MKWCLTISVALLTLLLSATVAAQEVPKTDDLVKLLEFVRPTGLVLSVFVLIGANVLLRFVGETAQRFGTRFTTKRLLIQKVESIARFSLYITTGLCVLFLSFEINRETLKLVALVFGFGIGLAMKDVAASVIAGIMIMFDRPFQVGDRVRYAGEYGDIIQIGLRSVRMRTLTNNIVTIPNNLILTQVTSSGNFGALDMVVVNDFFIGADQDLERAERLVEEAMLTSRYVYLAKPVLVVINQEINADLVVIRLRGLAYVLDTKYEKAFQTDVCKRVLIAFREHQILPPAPFERPPRRPGMPPQADVVAAKSLS